MGSLSQEDLDGIYAFAVDLGKRAGQMLVDAAQIRIDGGNATQEQKEHVQKENAVDLVTETDEGMYPAELLAIPHSFHVCCLNKEGRDLT
jgi:myo-inositol-1(or 4)-monophosphatase